MAKSKFFRVAVEGPTVDGRTIERDHLVQMAAAYNPATYTARINCEHIAGYSPDKPFNAYGSVLSLNTEEIELEVNGAKKKLLALNAEIDANDQLVAINKAGQKLFTSCEIHPNFAGEGKAYLVGLAVTDMPASLGTEPLKFAALARTNVFSPACETSIELLSASIDSEAIGEGIGRSLLAFFRKEKKDEPATPPVTPPAAPAPANDNALDVQAFATALGQQFAAAIKPTNDAVTALQAELTTLKGDLEKTEQPSTFSRTPATGGANGATIVTDC